MNDLAPFGSLPDLDTLDGDFAPLNTSVSLPQRAKAAIVVATLLNENADLPLADLPEESQEGLARALASMRLIDKDSMASIIAEFTEELARIGMAFPDGMAGALSALDGRISPHTAQRLRKEAGVRQSGDPWQRIAGLSTDALLPIVEAESVEVSAVLLSKIDTRRAAELLGRLPGDRARRITYAFSRTSQIKPDAMDRIGLALAAHLDTRPEESFDEGPVQRVGAILNSSSSAIRDDVLEGLELEDADFAAAVRKAIFTFINIAERIDPRDVPKITRELEPEALVTALAAAMANDQAKPSAEFILGNMSKRMAEQLREEVTDRGTVKPSEAEEAMSTVVGRIRDMEAEGKLVFQSGDD